MRDDVVICIPTNRKPPVVTLASYKTAYPVIIVADPAVYMEHLDYYADSDPCGPLKVAMGVKGMSAQVAECYRAAHRNGFPWYFRLDDDCGPKSFIHKDGRYPELDEVIGEARQAADVLKVSLVGFANTTNRYWLGEGYGRTYGLITGGFHLCHSSDHPEIFIDPTLPIYEDVWRSCSHRKHDGAVGRVKAIGVDKSSATFGTVVSRNAEAREESIRRILGAFPEFVTCTGTRTINGGRDTIANWRFRTHPGFKRTV